jgi:hypothetical protein
VWACAKKPEALHQLVYVCDVNRGCGIQWKENCPDALIQAFPFGIKDSDLHVSWKKRQHGRGGDGAIHM